MLLFLPVAAATQSPPAAEVAVEEACRSGEEAADDGIVLVRVCQGSFTMGSTADDSSADDGEQPAHRVTLSEFWIGKVEVTNAQYRRFDPDHTGDDGLPATGVSWNDARAFCGRFGFRLPTEAQWEVAARAGSRTRWSFGDDESALGRYGWYLESSDGKAHPVGGKDPNGWGLHDMHGNVWEWVADWYGPYSGEAQTDPTGPSGGSVRVLRGGSFPDSARVLRSAFRDWDPPVSRGRYVGFRCVRGARRQP